jgi:hypothetical protein
MHFLLLILPFIIGVPLRVLWEYFPQFGIAITIAAIINLCNGLLKASMSSLKIKNNVTTQVGKILKSKEISIKRSEK